MTAVMTLTLGFSPCPNDTFIFDALVNQKIDTGGLTFDVVMEDVETLNLWALGGKLDITKLSFPAFFQSLDHYLLLQSGSALGKGVGPLLVSATELTGEANVDTKKIAIPGVHTTANLLLSYAYPHARFKTPVIFSAIEDMVLSGRADLGVIIHENRFTYRQKGLFRVSDLGEYWERQTGQRIPLGGIAARRKLDAGTVKKVDHLIRQSLEYAFANYPLVPDFVQEYAQAMDQSVMRQHIQLYVNDYSLELGDGGRLAIESLYEVYKKINGAERNEGGLFSR